MQHECGAQSSGRPYHHGRLREALVDAGFELARASGPQAVVLRAVSRAAGVSHNAAYRHFADHGELLQAVAARCMGELAQLMRQRTAEVAVTGTVERAWAELRAIGRAYIEFAVREPGLFRTAFTTAPDPSGQPAEPSSGTNPGPYDLLSARLDRLVEVGAIPVARRPGAEFAAWSAVHGLSELFVEGPLAQVPEREREQAIDVVLDVVERGL